MFGRLLNRFSPFLIYMSLLSTGWLMTGFLSSPYDKTQPASQKLRLLVLTDISSLRSNFLEADDGQSMIRLMLYANEFDIEGLVANSKMVNKVPQQPQLIHQVIDAYEKVLPNLRQHDTAYPSAGHLRTLVKIGQATPIPRSPVSTFTSFGPGRDTEGSDWIIHVVDQPDRRPVWVNIWGGAADLAQALWKVQQTRPKDAVQTFVRKIRVRAITDQDSTGGWIVKNFPDFWYLRDSHSHRGMYRGGDNKSIDSLWVEAHLHNPANPLGMLYPNYYRGPGSIIRGVKEGDTPSFLAMIPNGLNLPDRPELGSWGGMFGHVRDSYYTDKVDSIAGRPLDREPYLASIYRWRTDWQADFQDRLDWCVKPYNQANHQPKAIVNGNTSEQPIEQIVAAGTTVTFDAGKSSDPDGNPLQFHWQIYPLSTHSAVELQNTDSAKLTVRVDPKAIRQLVPILLTVVDTGQPALRHYRRILLQISSH